jgi:hypothetical protein
MESIRKARTVPRCVFIWKSNKNKYLCDTLRSNNIFSFKKRNFLAVRFALFTKLPIFHYGTARANAFLRIDLFKDNRGTVRDFEINQSKR